jgi:uncharacterized membrane protein HdeD (DUF308 family)
MLFGALFIGVGIVEFVEALRSPMWQRGVLLGLAGIVALVAGLLTIARPLVGLVALTVVLLGYLVFVGAFRVIMALQLQRGMPGRFWAFTSGVVALVFAYLAIGQLPNIGAWLMGTYLGVSLILSGVARLSLARGVHRMTGLLGAPPPAARTLDAGGVSLALLGSSPGMRPPHREGSNPGLHAPNARVQVWTLKGRTT